MNTTDTSHSWEFYRTGGLDQVRFKTGADILNLSKLDPKLWVALACPVKGLEFDERTLALIDSDGDGRVRINEILETVNFLKPRLKSADTLLAGSGALALSAINDATPEGKATITSARRVLENIGKPDAKEIAFADIADPVKIFADTKFNGDGIITPASTDNAAIAAVITDIVATQGGATDRTGVPGADKAKTDAFFADIKALADWAAAAKPDATFGDKAEAAVAAVKAVRAKIDDFFARCRLAAYDARTLAAVNRVEGDYLTIAAKDFSVDAAEVVDFPIAQVSSGATLPFDARVNPAWAGRIAALLASAVEPAFGKKTSLTESEWRELNAKIAPFEGWASAKPATAAAGLGVDRVNAILSTDAEKQIAALIAKDAALAEESAGIDSVEKLVRLNRDFRHLLENFISFADFYNPDKLAIFQAGRLFLDSRECHLCIKVTDAGKHAAMAGLSKCYLAYCDVSRVNEAGATDKMVILAVFSQGDSDYLMVGRNGVFFDHEGRDWDATITKIIEEPISIRQAFWHPYKKFIRMIEELIAKRAAAADAKSNDALAAGATTAANADAPPPPAPKFDIGMIAALSVGLGAIGTVIGGLIAGFIGLGTSMPLGILGIILLISGPSMLIAALKLRQRNLGPILDANGWAVNGRVKVNIPFGTRLTDAAKLPENSTHTLEDPFAEKPSCWPKIIGFLLVVAFGLFVAYKFNLLNGFISDTLGKPAWAHVDAPAVAGEKKTAETK